MSVTLKITFNDDLRRVTLPTTTTFDDLKKRLSQMFSDYVLSNRLSYIDDEDDRVTIQTTEELQEAFRLSRGGVLRLFVEENEEDEDADYEELDSDDESDDRVHSAICDNCDERIVGIRYKCGNCADYDLCQSCEKHDGVHDSTHLFIKIRAPLSPWASPVRVLLPNLYPQQHQQVPCWARRVQQYMAQREQCERQRAAQREQYEQQAQRVQQARQQWFEQLRAQRAAQASNGCPRFAGQCGRPASSEQPQCGRPASAEHPFANFFQHLLQQIEALNEREEENNNNTNNTNNNNTNTDENTDENTEQPNPFRVVIHFRNNEEQKEEKTEQQAQPDVTSSEALVEDVVEDAPKQQHYQPEENQPILTDVQPEPSAPVVEEPKQEVVEQAKPVEPSAPIVESLPVEEKPKRELTRFEQLLNTLEDMGFTDRRKNIEVLVRTAGNLEAAVQSLISF